MYDYTDTLNAQVYADGPAAPRSTLTKADYPQMSHVQPLWARAGLYAITGIYLLAVFAILAVVLGYTYNAVIGFAVAHGW